MRPLKLLLFCLLVFLSAGCSSPNKDEKEYFVKKCDFVCEYPFDEVSKFAVTCRVWGLLKYYHPNVTGGQSDWDKPLLDAIEKIDETDDAAAVNAEIAKMLQTAGDYQAPEDVSKFDKSLNMNMNLCWIDNSFLDDDTKRKLHEISSITVRQPSRYGIRQDTTSRYMFENEKDYSSDRVLSSKKYRLLSLFRYWNTIYYWFPYKYMTDKSWDARLTEFIPKFASASDSVSYNRTVTEIAVTVNDGHAFVYPHNLGGIYEDVVSIDGKTVVCRPSENSLTAKGDIITEINRQDINTLRDSISRLIPSSNTHYTDYRVNTYISQLIIGDETELTVLRNGRNLNIRVENAKRDSDYYSSSLYEDISEKIGYVRLYQLPKESVSYIFERYRDTKGIIFDLRKFPEGVWFFDVLHHLSPKQKHPYLQFICSDSSHPGAFYREKQNYYTYTEEQLSTSKNYKGKTVVLINESTMSRGETSVIIYKTGANAVLVGRPTAGANGNLAKFSLPGGISCCFSGLGAFYPDGKEMQRTGIVPDIEVYPTMQSVIEGKDEILEAAIDYLNNL